MYREYSKCKHKMPIIVKSISVVTHLHIARPQPREGEAPDRMGCAASSRREQEEFLPEEFLNVPSRPLESAIECLERFYNHLEWNDEEIPGTAANEALHTNYVDHILEQLEADKLYAQVESFQICETSAHSYKREELCTSISLPPSLT